MYESVLVADRGLGAARVLATCRRLGIKSVLAGLSHDSDQAPTDAAHLADDLVLLSGPDELSDPRAVVRAGAAAGVQAIHPGYGPLRGDVRLARAAADAGLVAVVTSGVGDVEEIFHALAYSVPLVPMAAAGSVVSRWVYVLGAPTGVVVLGSVEAADGRLIAAAPAGTESGAGESADLRLAHAAAAVVGFTGLAAVGVNPDGVVDIIAGLPETHAAWELVTDVDLVELQLLVAAGESNLTARSEVPVSGVAIGLPRPEVVDDVRALDGLAEAGVRLDAVALAGSSHRALVRATAWGRDRVEAERALAGYVNRSAR